MFQSSFFLSYEEVTNINDDDNSYGDTQYDPTVTVNCGGSRYYQMAVPALFCLCTFHFLPALLLVFSLVGVSENVSLNASLTVCRLLLSQKSFMAITGTILMVEET